jgi:hypothetical protein
MNGPLSGQWLARYSGTNSGTLILDLDDIDGHYEGWAYAWDDNPALPGSMVFVLTQDERPDVHLSNIPVLAVNPSTAEPVAWETISERYPDVVFPKSATASAKLDDDNLIIHVASDNGSVMEARAPRTQASLPTEYVPRPSVTSWAEFKTFASGLGPTGFIFRGQRHLRRLRTAFHRTGRANLRRFLAVDRTILHRQLSSRTKHLFNLSIPDENGAFISLVQHHGYPTPLLDWTRSPYIAAFFAYREASNVQAHESLDKVRIFIFYEKPWRNDFPQFPMLSPRGPHFSVVEFLAVENERLIPQQSVSTVTNVDDIESYLRQCELLRGRPYLEIVDLPLSERSAVMRDLGTMGITAGSMLPGLDGACEELKERLFP